MQQGIAALAAARAARAPRTTFARVAEAGRFAVERSRILFVPATLDYLARGGRIGGAAALIGQVLRVRPLLTVTDGSGRRGQGPAHAGSRRTRHDRDRSSTT